MTDRFVAEDDLPDGPRRPPVAGIGLHDPKAGDPKAGDPKAGDPKAGFEAML
ncbi:hypothetical protein ACFU8W_02680 [Streptomyces sp. NPDC057565]|uniref:hypothetical protein n=1 Tax=Streptomyces sp. NPDC057565 TaxID=3346169 RepID=UPI0036971C6F